MAPKRKKSAMSLVVSWFRHTMQHRMLQDRLFIIFVFTAVALSLVILITGLASLRPKDTVVPLQYSSVQGFNVLGEWYRNFIFPVFSLLITGGNLYLALKSFEKSRFASFFLVMGTILVNLLVLVVFLVLISHIEV